MPFLFLFTLLSIIHAKDMILKLHTVLFKIHKKEDSICPLTSSALFFQCPLSSLCFYVLLFPPKNLEKIESLRFFTSSFFGNLSSSE